MNHRSAFAAAVSVLLACSVTADENAESEADHQASQRRTQPSCAVVARGDSWDSLLTARKALRVFVDDSRRAVAGVGGSGSPESIRFSPDSTFGRYVSPRGVVLEGLANDSILVSASESIRQLQRRAGALYEELALVAGRLASETLEEAVYSARMDGGEVTLVLRDAYTLTFECRAHALELRRLSDKIGRHE